MRTRSNVSTLAIAAVVILAAAATSFAQTNERADVGTVTVSASELTAVNAKQPASIENTVRESFEAKSVSEKRPVVKPLTISAATFAAGSRFATVNANQFVNQQLTADMKMSAGVPSTNANELSETTPRNVEFIPCRIPKFPYREN